MRPLLFPLFLIAALPLAACAGPFERKFHTEVEIEADVATVWRIVADVERYPEWNPYHLRVDLRDGDLCPGSRLRVHISKPSGRQLTLPPSVTRRDVPRQFAWGGGVPGLFEGEHVFTLEALTGRRTRLVQSERFSGLFVPFADLEGIEQGYMLVNEAVRRRAERNDATTPPVVDCAGDGAQADPG